MGWAETRERAGRDNIRERMAREDAAADGLVHANVETILERSFTERAIQKRHCGDAERRVYFVPVKIDGWLASLCIYFTVGESAKRSRVVILFVADRKSTRL